MSKLTRVTGELPEDVPDPLKRRARTGASGERLPSGAARCLRFCTRKFQQQKLPLPSWVGERDRFSGTSPLCHGSHSIYIERPPERGLSDSRNPFKHRKDENGREEFLVFPPPARACNPGYTWLSRELRACTPSQRTAERNERVLEANNNILPFSSFQ